MERQFVRRWFFPEHARRASAVEPFFRYDGFSAPLTPPFALATMYNRLYVHRPIDRCFVAHVTENVGAHAL